MDERQKLLEQGLALTASTAIILAQTVEALARLVSSTDDDTANTGVYNEVFKSIDLVQRSLTVLLDLVPQPLPESSIAQAHATCRT